MTRCSNPQRSKPGGSRTTDRSPTTRSFRSSSTGRPSPFRTEIRLPSSRTLFTANGWPAAWRNGIYPFHHFHSTAHEALGVYAGTATARFGGEGGIDMTVSAGDVVIIPAGVGHKAIEASANLGIVGAYPAGTGPDLCRGAPAERPASLAAIARGRGAGVRSPLRRRRPPSPTLVLSGRPRPNAAPPPPRARGRVATRRLGRGYSGISLTATQRRSASDRMVASQ